MFKTERIIIFAILHLCLCQEYIVEIDQGQLSGTLRYDRKGGVFYGFLGIPYAKPPVADLRFKEPQPAEDWEGIFDASNDMPACTQPDMGTEDCLYLNVFTPQIPSDSYDSYKDVMVFIHGGSFYMGSGNQITCSPEFLLTEDIVLVTINYRLGIFGSYHLSDASLEYPGNLLMQDQLLAFQWVQNNIAKFGGNPNSVTIFGESAGAASVHYHILSPLSTGLFHKAIIQSGTAISPYTGGLPNNGVLLAEMLNISTSNTSEMLSQILNKTTEEINAAQLALIAEIYEKQFDMLGCPIVQHAIDDQIVFLPDEPLSLIKQGVYNHVPILIGYNNIDGAGLETLYTEEFFKYPSDLGLQDGTQEAIDLLNEIDGFYAESEYFDYPLVQQYTDVWFGYPAYRAAVEHKKTTNSSIYFYRFSADTNLNLYKMFNFLEIEGAMHGEDLFYLFQTYLHNFITITPDSVEDQAIDRMVKLWTNFAKHGDPNPDDITNWIPIEEDTFNYAEIGSNETVSDVNPDWISMNFWNGIYDKYFST